MATTHDIVLTEFKVMGQGNVVGAFEQIGRSSSKLAFVAGGVGMLAGATLALGAAGVRAASKLEVLQMRLDTIFGGKAGGGAAMEWAKGFQQQTGLALDAVIDSVARMKAMGLDYRTMLGPIADTAAAMGLNSDGIQRIVVQLGQMKAAERASLEDLKILAEAGIPVFEILRQKMGLTGEEVRKIGEAGYDVDVVIGKLVEGMQERFGGGLAKYAGTLTGSFERLKGQMFLILGAIGEGINPALKDAAGTLEGMTKSGEWLAELTSKVERTVIRIQGAFLMFKGLGTWLATLFDGWILALNEFNLRISEMVDRILPGDREGNGTQNLRKHVEELRKQHAEIAENNRKTWESFDRLWERFQNAGRRTPIGALADAAENALKPDPKPKQDTDGAFQKYVESVLIGGAERARQAATGLRGNLGLGGLGQGQPPAIRLEVDTRDRSPLGKAFAEFVRQEFPKLWQQILNDPRQRQYLRRWLAEGA